MKKYSHIGLVIFLSLFFVLAVGCSYIKILIPSEEQESITTPFDLKVAHTGCGEVKPETFEAWLNKEKDNRKDITSYFSYNNENETWIASNYELPLGTHTFTASADVYTGGWCFVSKGGDKRDFTVYETTCIKGKVWYTTLEDPTKVRYPFAPITAHSETDGQLLAETKADEAGNYCIEVPHGGFKVNLTVFEAHPPHHPGFADCRGSVEGIDLGTNTGTCEEGDCINRDIITFCGT